ncbi:MAG: thiamine phosphate synthase [Paludibacteraceae bacterium]|nr:thiamine phosphate synthase [Paludibacteraceae bacterium]
MNTLCLVTDSTNLNGRKLADVVREAIEGGVNMVQLREKMLNTRDFVALAREVKRVTDEYNVPFLINDRVDVCLAVEADGVHLGQTDLPYNLARNMLGRERIIGLSVENIQQIMAANDLSVDYVGISPVFATPTKTDTATPVGLEGLKRAAELSLHPMIAIGGINKENAGKVMETIHKNASQHLAYHTNDIGSGIAVVSAIMSAKSTGQAARELADIMR